MKLLFKDDEVLTYLVGDNSLLDGYIEDISIAKGSNDRVEILVKIRMRSSAAHDCIYLKFEGCKEFLFSYSDDFYFYCIESLKFLKTEGRDFYISFDPYDEGYSVSDEDQDFIRSGSVKLFTC